MSNESLRILMVLDSIEVGGTETHVFSLAKEMLRKGTHIVIAGNKGRMTDKFHELGCPIYEVDFPYTLNIEDEKRNELISQVEQIIEKENISLVHAHQTPSAYLTFLVAKQRKIPTVFTVHGTYYPKSELLKVVELASATICVSPPVYEYVQEETSARPILIANGIDTKEYSERDVTELKAQLNIPKEAFVLLYSSRINWTKANICMMLLRACKDVKLSKAPHLHVVVVGDGPRFKDLQSLTDLIHRTCKESFIHLVGEKQDMQHYYPVADCVVGTGRVALEAMACTKPVLAVGNHGYFGLVDKNEYDNAWNYYFGDHNSRHACSRFMLARDLGTIIASSEQLKDIGIQSREWILNKFDVTKVTEELLELYLDKLKDETI